VRLYEPEQVQPVDFPSASSWMVDDTTKRLRDVKISDLKRSDTRSDSFGTRGDKSP
jgi:hypothetical protein